MFEKIFGGNRKTEKKFEQEDPIDKSFRQETKVEGLILKVYYSRTFKQYVVFLPDEATLKELDEKEAEALPWNEFPVGKTVAEAKAAYDYVVRMASVVENSEALFQKLVSYLDKKQNNVVQMEDWIKANK